MHVEGTVNIRAGRTKGWKSLTDANFVAACATGIKEMAVVVPDRKFRAVAAVGFGSVTTEFSADIEFVELIEPDKARIKAHGNAPGSAVDVISKMNLSDGPDGSTELKWTAGITVSGTIASLASRMMAPVTKKLTVQFFDCVKSRIEACARPTVGGLSGRLIWRLFDHDRQIKFFRRFGRLSRRRSSCRQTR